MKLYTVYDQLLDYWGTPFVGPNDKQVLQSISVAINSGDKTNAYAQAPNQFQLWQIAKIDDETTELHIDRKLVASLNSLLRGGIREGNQHTGTQMETTAGHSPANSGGLGSPKNPGNSTPHPATPPAHGKA